MSIKRYCELCEQEVDMSKEHARKGPQGRVEFTTSDGLMVEIGTGWDNTWNVGDFHGDCIIQAISDYWHGVK